MITLNFNKNISKINEIFIEIFVFWKFLDDYFKKKTTYKNINKLPNLKEAKSKPSTETPQK